MTTWRVDVRDPHGELHPVVIDADLSSRQGEVAAVLDDLGFHARPLGVNGHAFGDDRPWAELGVTHGDVIEVGRIGTPAPSLRPGWYVVAICGPDAGTWARVDEGSPLVIGRTGSGGLELDDPLMSRPHCEVSIVDGEARVTDLRSTNSTFVEGAEVTAPTVLDRSGHFQAGSTVFTVTHVSPDEQAVLGPLDGPNRVMPRQYRRALNPLPDRVEAPRTREPSPDSSSSGWWRAALPIVSGVGFALISGRWIFLLIVAIAPVILTFDALRRRRRTQRQRDDERAAHEAEMAAYRSRVITLRRTERARHRDSARCGGLASFSVEAGLASVWERAPGDEDFGSVTVGLASVESRIATPGHEQDFDAHLWGTPVATSLLRTGSLAVIGRTAPARSAARGLLISLASTHSPVDLRMTILTEDRAGSEWGFARWLPHVLQDDQLCRIGADLHARTALFTSIMQILDTRREVAQRDGLPLPIHVVIIDGTHLVDTGELTELLVHGPAHGIVCITLDERLAPEGVGATLVLASAIDTCSFQSRHQPRLDDVMVAGLSHGRADLAARTLARLRPAISEDQGFAAGTVHLVDLLDGAGGHLPEAESVARRWADGPRTAVTVGATPAGPMVVDLVRDGPHGLVGGTSGSGKTEFLKTFFAALALSNHPDDLSIAIVDFKGGVDHRAIEDLPHVVDVSTNLDIERFRRTITMLGAESQRRQALLRASGANNIDSYRQVRADDPSLPPLPRLLVVVDEFGELLESDGGREQLKELESITRIGRALGLHLLLVTQSFSGRLPPQIDANAGLRICLRVQKPDDSKAVLDSPVAATISDRHIGRAFARFRGRDLVEFQTARVAGRRRDLVAAASPVTARVVPFEALAMPVARSSEGDVPEHEQDLAVIIAATRAAAEATGWTRPAVPWPRELPEQVSTSALARAAQPGQTPLGLADVPDEQRRELVAVTDRDQQFALVGGPTAPLPEVLLTYGAALAASSTADDVHLYGIDLVGRSLGLLDDLPHCGGVAVRNEQLALRMIRWLAQVAAERKVLMAETGSASIWEHAARTGDLPPELVLLVSGVDRILQNDVTSNLTGPLGSLLSEAIGVRIQIVLAGLPRTVTHRLGSNIDRRFVFQLADPSDYPGVGVPRHLTSGLRVARRAADTSSERLVQFAQLSAPGGSDADVIRSLAAHLPPATHRPPRRFRDITWPLPWGQAPFDRLVPPRGMRSPLPIGVNVTDGEWLWIDVDDDGPVFAVVGSPKSGRSSTLLAIARFAAMQEIPVVNVVVTNRSPLAGCGDPAITRTVEPEGLAACLAETPGRVVVLLDDVHRLRDATAIEAVVEQRDRALIVVAGPPDVLGSRVGKLRSLPEAAAGVLLAAQGSMDGSAIGLRRLPAEAMSAPRAGRGLLAVAGEATEVQIPQPPLAIPT